MFHLLTLVVLEIFKRLRFNKNIQINLYISEIEEAVIFTLKKNIAKILSEVSENS